MLSREQAVQLLQEKIKNTNTVRHMLATEAVMRALAEKLGRDVDLWGVVGLLHDIDLEEVDNDMHRHASEAIKWLDGKLPPEALKAIIAHNGENLGIPRESDLDHALAAAETMTGLVVATTLVLPNKKLSELKAKSVLKRMKEPRFAASVNRETIRECGQFGMEVETFVGLGVEAMQKIAVELGL